MSMMSHVAASPRMGSDARSAGVLARFFVIALTAFLTVVDLFATQAILPSLTQAYGVSPAAMGSAVNASTLGMAIAGLGVAILSRKIDRRRGILISLAILAIPTALLASAPSLAVFTVLRILQGLCMATAFTLTLAYLGEHPSAVDAATASAAYITGNVASNFIGRFVSAAVADHFGLASNFYFFAALNLTGAVLVYFTVHRAPPAHCLGRTMETQFASWALHLRNPRAARGVRHRLLHPVRLHRHLHLRQFRAGASPLRDRPDGTGLRLFRVPSLGDHDAAGRRRHRPARHQSNLLGFARRSQAPACRCCSLRAFPRCSAGSSSSAVGTFFAQAAATGYVSRTATSDRGSASGIYLSCYFFGGMVGSAVLGQIFDRFGWPACVAGIGASLAIAALLASRLR